LYKTIGGEIVETDAKEIQIYMTSDSPDLNTNIHDLNTNIHDL